MASKKKFVIAKGDKFATVGGGLGSRPKVYETAQAAQFDIDSIPKLKGGAVRPYVDPDKVDSATAPAPMASTSKAKAADGTKAATPKRAAAGK